FLLAFQLLDDSASLDEEADLAAERFNHLKQILVRLDNVMAKQFHYAVDLAVEEKRKSKSTPQVCRCGIRSSAKGWVAVNVVYPCCFLGIPNTPLQALAFGKGNYER